MVCGSGSRVDGCTACCNGDTGILICAFPGADRQQWPNNNLIINCDSFHNCDPARENADGFGAKLSVGEGNRFVGCIAHHNVDDGFDLYSKQILGPIGAVTIENCAAYANGRREPGMSEGAGSGFKLGGEGLAIPHSVCGCVAFGNALAGFSPNSNPAPRLSRLNAWDNGQGIPDSDYRLPSGRNHVQPDRCISLPPASPQTLSAALSRGPDGALDLEPLLAAPHLLFLTPHLSGGGAEKVIAELASRLALTYHVTLMTTLPDDGSLPYPVSPFVDCRSLPQELEALRQAGTLPSRRQELPKPARRVLQVIFSLFVGKEKATARFQLATGKEISERTAALAEWKRQFGIDCSISFLNSANYLNVKSCVGERTIISVRSYLAGSFAPPDCRSKEGRMRIAEACRLADCIVPVSVETGACLVERYGAQPEKLHVILNGVDAQKLRAESKKEPRDTALAAAIDRIEGAELVLPSLCLEGLPAGVDDVMFYALDPDRYKRYATVEDFAEEMDRFLGSAATGRKQLAACVRAALDDGTAQVEDVSRRKRAKRRLGGRAVGAIVRSISAANVGVLTFAGLTSISALGGWTNPICWAGTLVAAALGAIVPRWACIIGILAISAALIYGHAFVMGGIVSATGLAWWIGIGRLENSCGIGGLSGGLFGAAGLNQLVPLLCGYLMTPGRAAASAAFASVLAFALACCGSQSLMGWSMPIGTIVGIDIQHSAIALAANPTSWIIMGCWVLSAVITAACCSRRTMFGEIVGIVLGAIVLAAGAFGVGWYEMNFATLFTPSLALLVPAIIAAAAALLLVVGVHRLVEDGEVVRGFTEK